MDKEKIRQKFLIENPEFTYESKNYKYIYKYKNRYIKKNLLEFNCGFCGNVSLRKRNNKKFCSYSCRKKNSAHRYAYKQNVRWKVWKALKTGRLVKPNYCENCKKNCVPEGHHKDYNKPINVEWLCVVCHKKADKLL